jgi:hypothetical protein
MFLKQYNINFALSRIASLDSLDQLWRFIGLLAHGLWFWTRAAISTLFKVGFLRLNAIMDFLKWSHRNKITTLQLLL